jgi:hypothetical protein
MVDLRSDGEQVRQAFCESDAPHVPLPLAAAMAFHEAHPAPAAVVPQLEYDDALNLTAAALSRLVAIYRIDERTRRPVEHSLNLTAGRFRDGAAAYESKNGRRMTSLLVLREHLPTAMALIKATGIPFHFDGLR